jgi:hypothetical protein
MVRSVAESCLKRGEVELANRVLAWKEGTKDQALGIDLSLFLVTHLMPNRN